MTQEQSMLSGPLEIFLDDLQNLAQFGDTGYNITIFTNNVVHTKLDNCTTVYAIIYALTHIPGAWRIEGDPLEQIWIIHGVTPYLPKAETQH